jgi:lactate dehydrogenase-like 2-hydroxyacid dehydrogenase
MSQPCVLTAAALSPYYLEGLQALGYEVLDRLHERDPDAFALEAPRIRAVAAAGDSTVGADLIARLPALEVVSVMGVGYDGVDLGAALPRGIAVGHTPGVLNDDVADLALALMLAVSRGIVSADAHVRAGRWPTSGRPLQRKMSGARLGVVGMGRIGRAIAQRALAFDMSVAYNARQRKDNLPWEFYDDVVSLAEHSDFLVLITPGGAGTHHLVDARVLAALGPQGYLINVARGSVVDEAALVDALAKGVIAGAGLDVFEREPAVPEALWRMEQVVLTPHIGSATHQTRRAMAALACDNMRAHFEGRPLSAPVPEWVAQVNR